MLRDEQTHSTANHRIRSGTGSPCQTTVDGSGNLSPGPVGSRTPTQTSGQKGQSGVKGEPLDQGQGVLLKVQGPGMRQSVS